MAPTTILFKALVTLLRVAVTGLHRGAVTVAVDAVAGASALLDSPAARHGTRRPFGPGGPSVHCIVTRGSTARAALSVGHGGVGAGDERAGDFATHSSRVLAGTLCAAVHGPLILVPVHDAIVEADAAVDLHLVH